MKKLISIIPIFLISAKIFACSCAPYQTTQHFLSADFVATAEIKTTYTNDVGHEYYRTDIIIKNLYKGNSINSINVDGFNKVKDKWSSCDIILVPGSKWLIFGYKDRNGYISSGFCSMRRADDYYFKNQKIPFILQTLKENSNQLAEKYPRSSPRLSYENYKTFGSEKIGDYTLVSVKLDPNLNVVNVHFFTNDNDTAKKRIEAEIKKYPFKEYVKKNNINAKNGFYYIYELNPYSNIVEPDLKRY
ncbi:hypothetical protein [Pedobacter nototheniae]|uniref:hypothetical protein n=1 Tax=Pedobacter nototheniae TaxID=2488994 RepID=UPI00292F0CB9|nr:hypothetical protein [Pedobacter nototheniae]